MKNFINKICSFYRSRIERKRARKADYVRQHSFEYHKIPDELLLLQKATRHHWCGEPVFLKNQFLEDEQ